MAVDKSEVIVAGRQSPQCCRDRIGRSRDGTRWSGRGRQTRASRHAGRCKHFAILKSGIAGCEQRVGVAVIAALVVRSHGQSRLRDREVARCERERIVPRRQCAECRRDRVRSGDRARRRCCRCQTWAPRYA